MSNALQRYVICKARLKTRRDYHASYIPVTCKAKPELWSKWL